PSRGFRVVRDGNHTYYVIDRDGLSIRVEFFIEDNEIARVTLCVDDSRPAGLRVHALFSRVDTDELVDMLCALTATLDATNYEHVLRPSVDRLQASLFEQWRKPGVTKQELSDREREQVATIVAAFESNGWRLEPGWRQLYDAGVGVAPLLHADKNG